MQERCSSLNTTPTIRTHLQEFLDEKQLSMNRFADSIHVNVGIISKILSGNRPIPVQQLDLITAGMGLEEGYFYNLYITECFDQGKLNWRRLRPLLIRCSELNKLQDIERMLRLALDNLNYIPLLFNMAEQFFNEGKKEVAILIYEAIAESERTQHSERLALCQYRLFSLRLNDDYENNLLVATQFEPYVERLEEAYQLDAVIQLLNINGSLSRWEQVERNAHNLLDKASKQYKLFGRSTRTRTTARSLIFYILYAQLALGDVYFKLDQYEKALKYVDIYADVKWVNDPDSEEKKIIDQFNEWAVANRLLYRLMAGQVEILPDYVNHISTRENEIFLGMHYIIKTANNYQLNIDDILERFKSHLTFKTQKSSISKINDQITLERYTNLLRELGVYYLNKGDFEIGVQHIIDSLEYSIRINNKNTKLKCLTAILEISLQHDEYNTNETFKNLMHDVLEMSKQS